MRFFLIALLASCYSASTIAQIAFVPQQGSWHPNDPNPTLPLVENPPPNPEVKPVATNIGPVAAGVTGAVTLAWLLGAAAPLIGLTATFDENQWFVTEPVGP